MGKALTGLAEIGAAGALVAGAFFTGGADFAVAFATSSGWGTFIGGLAIQGIASEAGAIADALTANRGAAITTRQPAANAGIVYGEARIGGVMIYASTTGSHKDQYNKVVALAGHTIDSIVNLYLDGRQVHFTPGVPGSTDVNGLTFGGAASGGDFYDAGNVRYNFDSLVYAEGSYGVNAPGYFSPALNANDPTWAPTADGSPYGGDVSYCYVKVEYDTSMFQSQPEMRFTIRGRNQIWDPRTGTTGYSTNAALIAADVLMNSDWGLGVAQALINVEQLITAANICDEEVPLANGTTEPRYTFNGAFDSSSSPGDILQGILAACGGSFTFSGGQYYIFVAAAYPTSFNWTQNDLLGGIQGSSYRSNRDLFNRVSGTFVAPTYPYAPVGNLYSGEYGRDPDNYSQNNFDYAWQKTSYPTYAQDVLHGYPSDQWLTADGGIEKWSSLNLSGVISLATAQRLAKISLLRNRLQTGTYSFTMKLQAYQMMVQDVFTLTFPQLGWTNKLLQVTDIQLVPAYDSDSPPGLSVSVTATDFNPDVYAWSTTEELNILDVPVSPQQNNSVVNPPLSVTVASGPGIDLVSPSGVITPRVQVSWSTPEDAYVTTIEVQYLAEGSTLWITGGSIPVANNTVFLTGFVNGVTYDFQVRAIRANGASSVWVSENGLLIAATDTSVTSLWLAPNIPFNVDNNATIDSVADGEGAVSFRVYGPGGIGTPWTYYTGQGTYTVPAGSFFVLVSGLTAGVAYVLYNPSTSMYETTQDYAQTVPDAFIGVGFVTVDTSGTTATSGTGGGAGTGSGGGVIRGCTVEGTELDTPTGPMANTALKEMFDEGAPVYLMGRYGPERLLAAVWLEVDEVYRVSIGDSVFECSSSHTLCVDGKHSACSTLLNGTQVETRDGYKGLHREAIKKSTRVLRISLDGPSHEYSVGGVFTHNAKNQAPVE